MLPCGSQQGCKIKQGRARSHPAIAPAMPRRSDAPVAAATEANQPAAKSPRAHKRSEASAKLSSKPLEMIEVVRDDLVVKCDHATAVLIPDNLDQPYC
eukprot:1685884-Pleurochrysis_carterae.AAC.1